MAILDFSNETIRASAVTKHQTLLGLSALLHQNAPEPVEEYSESDEPCPIARYTVDALVNNRFSREPSGSKVMAATRLASGQIKPWNKRQILPRCQASTPSSFNKSTERSW